MLKSLVNINGVPSLVLTCSSGRGVVVITDTKRTGVPETIEKGALFTVYPYGQECGVMISHTALNRKAVQYASAPALEGGMENTSDEQLLMRAAQNCLAKAQVTCAEFDPWLADASDARLPNPVEEDGGAARLATAREFNRIAGEKLHRKLTTAEAKHKQRALVNAQRKAQISAMQRRNREKKLVLAIAQFRRIPGGPSYFHYLQLQVRGAGDVFSQMDDESVVHRSGPKHVIEVRRWLSDAPEIAAAHRWILRGLSPNMAIRKVIADTQERDLAHSALPPTPATSYTYRRTR
jgi:hypothetical protein